MSGAPAGVALQHFQPHCDSLEAVTEERGRTLFFAPESRRGAEVRPQGSVGQIEAPGNGRKHNGSAAAQSVCGEREENINPQKTTSPDNVSGRAPRDCAGALAHVRTDVFKHLALPGCGAALSEDLHRLPSGETAGFSCNLCLLWVSESTSRQS